MKSVLISIRPKWVEKIASGEKTIEVRKSAPKGVPFKAYIYCCKGNNGYEWLYRVDDNGRGKAQSWHGKVIGEFICDKVVKYDYQVIACSKYEVNGADVKEELRYNAGACLTAEEMFSYSKGKTLYGWHISDLKIYDKPRALSEFKRPKKIIARTCGMQARNGLCCAIDHEELCDNIKCCFKTPCPPQSWMHIEDLGETK